MNRADFFKRLFVGVTAAPAIVRVISWAQPPPFVFCKMNEWRAAIFSERKALEYRVYDSGIWWGLDQHPLHFEMRPSGYVGEGTHKINLQTGEIS